MRTIICKSCGKEAPARYNGLCQVCWRYFKYDNYKEFDLPEFGKIGYVEDEKDRQYGMVICHICGKAFTKLQQHIYYAHHIYKKDYCLQFGLDNKVRLTSDEYHIRMREYAYKYDMPKQLMRTGKATRFKKGHNNNYIRSPMTIARLKSIGFSTIIKNTKNNELKRGV